MSGATEAPAEIRLRLNPEQQAAADATGEVLVSAGAGTGKTSVLVHRFVRDVCERGIDVDSILVITYTRKASAELRSRVRAALVEAGRLDLARQLDGAWISTIHGFCNRLLKAHPFEVGLDPRFRELDDAGAAVIRGEAFAQALTAFCAGGDPDRLRLLATYGAAGLRRMLTGVYETLTSAGRDLVLQIGRHTGLPDAMARFRDAAQSLMLEPAATVTQRTNAEQALLTVADDALPERLTDLSALRCRGDRAATYEETRKLLERAALEVLAERDRDLLQELLERFRDEYAQAKRRESVVDFEDLQLGARELLRSHPEVRDRESSRFRVVMVDEFQDTNRLQCEIVDLLTREGETERFFVGDEFQSIYGFRHADVEVFRERRRAAPNPLALRRNYRSRPEVLAAVNHLFSGEFGEDFQPLMASGEFPDPVFGHPVELLVTDKTSYKDSGEHWRRGEARAIANRVRELVDNGAAQPGEIVLLFAAGTDAEWYEQELRRKGLKTHRATGRGYFGQQQVADLLLYLRLLRNRYDDVALASVLASPFVGLSNDALVQIRRFAGRRPLFSGIERMLPPDLSARDTQLLRAFKQRYERLVGLSARVGLESLCEQVLVEHDYDLAVLARWDGVRRYANMRKLARLGRAFESLRGSDLEGFISFITEQDALGAKELEAVAEEEGGDAVRLLTIHAAKGLEFRVVVVADAGRDTGGASDPDEILALTDGRFGFRHVHPEHGGRAPVFEYEAVKAASAEQGRAERLRLYYVAMTRAVERLIVSGAVDATAEGDRETPIAWVLGRLEVGDTALASVSVPTELERGEARFLIRVDRPDPDGTGSMIADAGPATADSGSDTDDGELQLSLFGELAAGSGPPSVMLPVLSPIPRPGAADPRRLSFSSIELYERCSLRFWAERVARLRPGAAGAAGAGPAGLHATEVGDAVHRLLELVDPDNPVAPSLDAVVGLVTEWYPAVTAVEIGRIGLLTEAYCESDLARRVAALGGARPERPFTFEHDGVLLRGRLDLLWRSGTRALVVDYKTNTLAERSPHEIVAGEYQLQRQVYALACLLDGAEEVEVAYQFLESPADIVSSVYGRPELTRLQRDLSDAIARVRSGVFEPRPSIFNCQGCPLLDIACAGPGLLAGDDGWGREPENGAS